MQLRKLLNDMWKKYIFIKVLLFIFRFLFFDHKVFTIDRNVPTVKPQVLEVLYDLNIM